MEITGFNQIKVIVTGCPWTITVPNVILTTFVVYQDQRGHVAIMPEEKFDYTDRRLLRFLGKVTTDHNGDVESVQSPMDCCICTTASSCSIGENAPGRKP